MIALHSNIRGMIIPLKNPTHQPKPSQNYPHKHNLTPSYPSLNCQYHVLSPVFISPNLQNQLYCVHTPLKHIPALLIYFRTKIFVLLLHHRRVVKDPQMATTVQLGLDELAAQLINLNCDDEPVIDLLDDEEDLLTRREWELSLIGKIISDKYIDPQAIMRAMRNAWFRITSLSMHEMEEGMVAFKFTNEADLLFAKDNGPWLVNDYLLVLRRWMPNTPVTELSFDTMPFWIKAYNIPCEKIKKSTGVKLGMIAGTSMDVDFVETRDSKCKFMRFRALIQLSNRVIPGTWITLEARERIWSSFRYERLPVYCFFCGIIGHTQNNCKELKIKEAKKNKGEEKEMEIPIHKQYGPWLKALSREAEINEKKALIGGFKNTVQGGRVAGKKDGAGIFNPNRSTQKSRKQFMADMSAGAAQQTFPAVHTNDGLELMEGPTPGIEEFEMIKKTDDMFESVMKTRVSIPPGFGTQVARGVQLTRPGPSNLEPNDQFGLSSPYGLQYPHGQAILYPTHSSTSNVNSMHPMQDISPSISSVHSTSQQGRGHTTISNEIIPPPQFSVDSNLGKCTSPGPSNNTHPISNPIIDTYSTSLLTEPLLTTNTTHQPNHPFASSTSQTSYPTMNITNSSTIPYHTTPPDTMQSYHRNNNREEDDLNVTQDAYEDDNCRRKRRFHSQNSIKLGVHYAQQHS